LGRGKAAKVAKVASFLHIPPGAGPGCSAKSRAGDNWGTLAA
jgi:hypothetical protein